MGRRVVLEQWVKWDYNQLEQLVRDQRLVRQYCIERNRITLDHIHIQGHLDHMHPFFCIRLLRQQMVQILLPHPQSAQIQILVNQLLEKIPQNNLFLK